MILFRMQNINQKIISGLEVMEFFFTNQWQWDIKNADALQTVLCPKDKEVLVLNMARLLDIYLDKKIIGFVSFFSLFSGWKFLVII